MKTLESLYEEVMASDELKKEFAEATGTKESLTAWLKKHDCDATLEELAAFLHEKKEGEMQDDEIEAVAGGKSSEQKDNNALYSFLTLGVGCVVTLVVSAAKDNDMTATECYDDVTNRMDEKLPGSHPSNLK